MFTIEQINEIHSKFGEAKTLLQYVRALDAIGVKHADSYVADGHTAYFGNNDFCVESTPAHEILHIAETSDSQSFLHHLKLHNDGKTSYLEMSQGLAESGTEKWTIDTRKLTMIFYDKHGNKLLVDKIK